MGEEGRMGIQQAGVIEPGRSSGKVWLTLDTYASGNAARAALALDKTPTGYFKIPLTNVPTPVHIGQAIPLNVQPRGGTEVVVTSLVSIDNSS